MTGEVLKLAHVARGLDAEGALLVDIVINGFVPPMLLTSNLNLHVGLSNSWTEVSLTCINVHYFSKIWSH